MTSPTNKGAKQGERNTQARVPRQVSLSSLEDLLGCAERCATLSMRECGEVRPTFMILTGEGTLLLLPGNMADEREKDTSAMTARLVCLAHDANAVVVVSEAWMSVRSHRSAYELPSEAPDRKEVVMLLGEAYGSRKMKFLPILRSESGAFRGFGDSSDSPYDSVEGRFTNILPAQRPTSEVRAEAKRILAAMVATSA